MRQLFAALKILIFTGLLICPPTPGKADTRWHLTDITGHLPDLRFSLVNERGQAITEHAVHGKVSILFFGFTSCASVCPATLERLARILEQLETSDNDIKVLFVTIDPRTDTPPVMREFLARFTPAPMTGLSGREQDIAALAKRYRAAYRPAQSYPKGAPLVHSAALYIFDRQGKARLLATPKDRDTAIIADLQRLVDQ